MNSHRLAVVIPAYKKEHIGEALAALAGQTCRDFTVYIGDDASPELSEEICAPFRDRLAIVYHRFADNLGARSLVGQWNRCVRLSDQPWVWIFSDDDRMEPECVAAFFSAIAKDDGAFELYRFNTLTIDAHGQIIKVNPPHPPLESGLEFAYHRLCFHRRSFLPEYIFSREVFDRHGGVPDFPKGWCADDAAWITFAENRGIRTIPGPLVSWRQGSANISVTVRNFRDEICQAMFRYLDWLLDDYAPPRLGGDDHISLPMLRREAYLWLLQMLKEIAPLGPAMFMAAHQKLSALAPAHPLMTMLRLTRINADHLLTRAARGLRRQG